jgi:adenylate/nucleoside-diphosphate kinase
MDLDEEEEDAAGDEEEAEEEAGEEEEEDPSRSLKKNLGDTNYFCPVALKENFVLWPGNPEVAAKYRERIYYISSPENREKFLLDPVAYLPKDKPLSVS